MRISFNHHHHHDHHQTREKREKNNWIIIIIYSGLRSDFYYERTQYRLCQFIIGISTGYIMKKHRHIKLRRLLQSLAWLSVTTFSFLHIFILYPRPSLVLSHDNRMIYNLFARDLFSLSISWIIVFCHKLNSDGAINRFLSHRCWHSTAKMCLSIYLVHYVYMTLTLANQKESYYVDSWWLLHVFAGDVVICLALSLVFHLAVEVPLANLLNCISWGGSNDESKQKLVVWGRMEVRWSWCGLGSVLTCTLSYSWFGQLKTILLTWTRVHFRQD